MHTEVLRIEILFSYLLFRHWNILIFVVNCVFLKKVTCNLWKQFKLDFEIGIGAIRLQLKERSICLQWKACGIVVLELSAGCNLDWSQLSLAISEWETSRSCVKDIFGSDALNVYWGFIQVHINLEVWILLIIEVNNLIN